MKTRIRYKVLTPVSHIGEVASTGSYFQTILTQYGRVPVITGNSIRGQIRDSIAIDLLSRINTKVDKDIFNIFFSGGNIGGTLKEDVEKAKRVREHFPSISLLGGGLGDMIMSGKLISSFAFPLCRETEDITGEFSEKSWKSMIEEIEFTRVDDAKNDAKAEYIIDPDAQLKAKASTQMRFSVQYMAAGTEFLQDIYFLEGTNELEEGAFYAGLAQWFKYPKIGGMAAKGFGLFDAVVGDDDIILTQGKMQISERIKQLIDSYHDFVDRERDEWFFLLKEKGGEKNGKKTNSAAKGDSQVD